LISEMNRLSSLLGFLFALPLIPVLLWWQKHERRVLFEKPSAEDIRQMLDDCNTYLRTEDKIGAFLETITNVDL